LAPNNDLVWYYHSFGKTTDPATKRGPSDDQIKNLRNKLCEFPKSFDKKSLQYNFAPRDMGVATVGPAVTKQLDCKNKVSSWVGLGNTKEYFKDVLEVMAKDANWKDLASDVLTQFASIP
jgi:hypothetical protein